MPGLINFVKETVSGTPGTGAITLGGASTGGHIQFQDHPDATNGSTWLCVAEDGNNLEHGIYTWNTGNTLTRTTILETLVSGTYDNTSPTAISLSSATTVSVINSADATGIIIGSKTTKFTTAVSPAATMPNTTIPVITDGYELMTVSYTPKFADSVLRVTAQIGGMQINSGVHAIFALFRDATTNALTAGSAYGAGGGSYIFEPRLELDDEPANATVATTFRLRVGSTTGASVSINGFHGGIVNTFIRVEEIRQ